MTDEVKLRITETTQAQVNGRLRLLARGDEVSVDLQEALTLVGAGRAVPVSALPAILKGEGKGEPKK